MNLTLVGLFSLTVQGVEGSVLQMLSHGLVSGALFLCVGVLYDRYHSRLVKYYSGVAHSMPLYVTVFLFFTMANIGLPGTSSFIGEFIIILGTYQVNTFVAVFSASGMVLGAAYSLWLFNRIAYGNLKTCYAGFSNDLSRREFYVFVPLIILTLFIGVYPEVFLVPLHVSCQNLINHVCLYKGF
jgi:NADH-quinone oxidoreductase subunit M